MTGLKVNKAPPWTRTSHAAFRRANPFRDNKGEWLYDKSNQCPGKSIKLNPEMKKMKARWAKERLTCLPPLLTD